MVVVMQVSCNDVIDGSRSAGLGCRRLVWGFLDGKKDGVSTSAKEELESNGENPGDWVINDSAGGFAIFFLVSSVSQSWHPMYILDRDFEFGNDLYLFQLFKAPTSVSAGLQQQSRVQSFAPIRRPIL